MGNTICGGSPEQLLIMAVARGDISSTQELLEKGANPNARNGQPLIDIITAEWNLGVLEDDDYGPTLQGINGLAIVNALLKAGADPNVRDNEPLMIAAKRGKSEVVKLLLDAGADAKARDSLALVLAENVRSQSRAEIPRLLIAKGADPNIQNGIALLNAVRSCTGAPHFFVLIEDFLKKGACPNIKDAEGTSLLRISLQLFDRRKWSIKLAKLLFSYGASLALEDDLDFFIKVGKSDNEFHLMFIKKLKEKNEERWTALCSGALSRNEKSTIYGSFFSSRNFEAELIGVVKDFDDMSCILEQEKNLRSN